MIHPGSQLIAEHRHDWICLTLPILGSGVEISEGGEARLDGPSAVLHPPGMCHSDRIDDGGLETVSLQFEPAWLRHIGLEKPLDRTRCWTGGRTAAAARRVALAWTNPRVPARSLAEATAHFLNGALVEPERPRPAWLDPVSAALRADPTAGAGSLARGLGLHPASLARAYRAHVGEGLQETVRRLRVHRAVRLLRGSRLPLAEIALAAGFCDQSHMNRCFRAVIGRTPLKVRAEGERLDRLGDGARPE